MLDLCQDLNAECKELADFALLMESGRLGARDAISWLDSVGRSGPLMLA
jgi:hypothetical protein